MARKTMWERLNMDNKLSVIEGWVAMGLNQKEMYTALGISKDTWSKWKKKHKEFSNILNNSQLSVVGELVASAKKQALGYYVEETQNEMGSQGFKKTIKKKFITPNGHMTKYLLNNFSDKFNDKQIIEHEIHSLEDFFADEKRVKNLTKETDEK